MSMRAMRVVVFGAVVPTCFHRFGAQKVVEIFSAIVVCPLFDHFEHGVVHFTMRVSQCRMMEYTYAIVQNLIDRNIGVIPGIDDARSNVLQDSHGNLTSWLVQ